jgi:hypothetical protein
MFNLSIKERRDYNMTLGSGMDVWTDREAAQPYQPWLVEIQAGTPDRVKYGHDSTFPIRIRDISHPGACLCSQNPLPFSPFFR